MGLRQESTTAETEIPPQGGRGCRGSGCENTLPVMGGLPCVCLAKLCSCKQVRVYMWGNGENKAKSSKLSLDETIQFHPITKSQLPRDNTKMPNASKNNRFYLTSVTEHTHLVPLTKHSHSRPITLSPHFGNIIRRMSQEGTLGAPVRWLMHRLISD